MMAGEFLISEDRLKQLRATRSGRMSYAGYNYQCGYAVSRLASMVTEKPLFDVTDYPRLLRYDWAEDLDELLDDGSICFTQCKRIGEIGQPAKLADVLLGFAPKWLWTPSDNRGRLRFRLVSCDPTFRNGFNKAAFQADTLGQFKKLLENDPARNSDRSAWQPDAIAIGIDTLFDALWSKLTAVYVASESIADDRAGPILVSEDEALHLLLRRGFVSCLEQKDAINDLRRLINDGLISFDPTSEQCPSLPPRSPISLDAADVRTALFSKKEGRRPPAFRVVDRVALSKARGQPKQKFSFGSPEWHHVVHGTDCDIKFIERDQTDSLREKVLEFLIQPLQRGTSDLPVLFVTGAPGAGKTTLVRRVAARLVESGDAVVADAGLNLAGGPADLESYAEDLQELAAEGRPVLLVLDDPLFPGSGWIDLLVLLKQPGFPVAVIAATPDFLYQQHRSQLIKLSCTPPFVLGRPTSNEKRRFAQIYDRDVATFGQHSDDFLALVAEAEAGEQLPQIMRRLWQTLNHGKPFDERVSFRELPWEVRAFWFVCFFHRDYALCPMATLEAALKLSGGSGATTNVETALAKLKEQSGWHIFRIHSGVEPAGNCQGEYISVAHQKIASAAWDCREMTWFDNEVETILKDPTAAFEPQSIRSIATAAAIMAKSVSTSQSRVAQAIVARLQKAAADSRRLTTRNLCELAAVLMTNRRIDLSSLAQTLRSRATGKDGWLAALQLWMMSSDDDKLRSFPSDLDLVGLIATADFSIKPHHAIYLFKAIGADTALKNTIHKRLFASLEGKLDWRLGPSLLAWLLPDAPPQECAKRFREIAQSLRRHDYDSFVRRQYLKLLQALPGEFDDERKQAVVETADWLKRHDGNNEVRTHYLKLLEGLPATFDDQRNQAVVETADWLKRHDDDSFVRTKYLSFLRGLPAACCERTQVVIDIADWLKRHDDDSYVRTQYLKFFEGLPAAFDEQRQQAVRETVDWLKRHDDDSYVRTQYLSFLLELPAAFDDQRKQAVIETADWLRRHENDDHVRAQYLSFLQELPAVFDDHRVQVAKETNVWLERHPQSHEVRRRYVKFLRFVDAPELKPLQGVSDQHHQQLIANNPKRNTFSYAEQLIRLGRFEDAIAQYDIVLKQHKGHEAGRRGRAFALQKLGRMAEAESEFKHALFWARAHKVSEAKFHTSLGEFYVETKQWGEAIKSFELAQRECPNHFSNHLGIAEAHIGLGNHRAAEQSLELAFKGDGLKPSAESRILHLLQEIRSGR